MNSTSSSTAAQPPLILCIDDADVALRVRKLLLGSEGYSVLTAQSGEAGLEIFRQNPIELVIADHFLSAKTGTEIAREMKAPKPEVPILIISAAMEKPSVWKTISRGNHRNLLCRRRLLPLLPHLALVDGGHQQLD